MTGRKRTRRGKFSFVLDKACNKQTSQYYNSYIKGLVHSPHVSSRTNQSFGFCLRFVFVLANEQARSKDEAKEVGSWEMNFFTLDLVDKARDISEILFQLALEVRKWLNILRWKGSSEV